MSAVSDGEFLRLLQKDIEYFERSVERFEDLIPRVCAPVQDQWRLQGQIPRHLFPVPGNFLWEGQGGVSGRGGVGKTRENPQSAARVIDHLPNARAQKAFPELF